MDLYIFNKLIINMTALAAFLALDWIKSLSVGKINDFYKSL